MDFSELMTTLQRIFVADFLRYFIAASTAYLIFWVFFIKRLQHRIIQKKRPKPSQMWMEFRYSVSTALIFAIVGTGIFVLTKAGYTQIYTDIATYGWTWMIVSFIIMLLFHDTYFYWAHRFMHHPKVFKHVHLVHHRSTNPSPWAAYSFHPLEAVIETAVFQIIVISIPTHPLTLFAFLTYMISRNVIGHLGIEIFPSWFLKTKWLSWITVTTHHDLHHKNFNTNYGLYFSWWDKIMGTEDKAYEETFYEVTSREREKGKSIIKSILKQIPLLSITIGFITSISAQSNNFIFLNNPSFEGQPKCSITPNWWTNCGDLNETPPDIHPSGAYLVQKTANHLDTYLGLVVKDNDTQEAVGQTLEQPLLTDSCYTIALDLSISTNFFSISKLEGKEVRYISPTKLRVWGGTSICDRSELLAETTAINNRKWERYELDFSPQDSDVDFLIFEAYYADDSNTPANGHILIDNISPIISCGMKINSEEIDILIVEEEEINLVKENAWLSNNQKKIDGVNYLVYEYSSKPDLVKYNHLNDVKNIVETMDIYASNYGLYIKIYEENLKDGREQKKVIKQKLKELNFDMAWVKFEILTLVN